MGYWGSRPDQNDQSHDLFIVHVALPAEAGLKRLFAEPDVVDPHVRWDRLGFLRLVLEAGILIEGRPVVDTAIRWLKELLDKPLYDNWWNDWRDPAKTLAEARAFLTDLHQRVATGNGLLNGPRTLRKIKE